MKLESINKILLFFSSAVLLLIALSFGGNPQAWVPQFYGVEVANVQAAHTFRSVMGLLLGVIGFLLYGAINKRYTMAALHVLMFAMFGLVAGRVISLLLDGTQLGLIFYVYVSMELMTGIITALLIRYHINNNSNK
ncbi:DUF4345 domain-containing protein [Sunxiuqinia rutila]|uniref:DUF4345 domain-containing protein n=1 Tax=Sunxiuqinia rutila TaxID=1397841 RepID=UPI003D361B4A